MPGLDEISFALGELKAAIAAVKGDTEATREEVSGVSKRVKSLEMKGAYDRGAASQYKKIAAAAGSVSGGLVAAALSWCKSKGIIP